jgi:hypothetical protein
MKSYVTEHRIRIREFGIVLRKNSHPPSTVSSIFKAPNSLHFVAPKLTQISSRSRRSAHTQASTRFLTNSTLWRGTQEHRREFYSNGEYSCISALHTEFVFISRDVGLRQLPSRLCSSASQGWAIAPALEALHELCLREEKRREDRDITNLLFGMCVVVVKGQGTLCVLEMEVFDVGRPQSKGAGGDCSFHCFF